MAPVHPTNLSPSELSYLHSSLSLSPPIRPDARSPTTFRPLVAETDLLPGCNGSARLCFADGTEALVGVKAEVEKTPQAVGQGFEGFDRQDIATEGTEDAEAQTRTGDDKWIEVTVDIPGQRDDDPLIAFLGAMLHEALVADGTLASRLWLNDRWHWRLYIDILLLSPPLSYPLPLLSLTTHLALLTTSLPAPISARVEDPLFNDDWAAALPLYPAETVKPPVTLLVISVGGNIFFDPSASELSVADSVLAVSVTRGVGEGMKVLAIRTIDSPARLSSAAEGVGEGKGDEGVWRPPRGGMKRDAVRRMVKMVTQRGGVAEEVLNGLEGLDVG